MNVASAAQSSPVIYGTSDPTPRGRWWFFSERLEGRLQECSHDVADAGKDRGAIQFSFIVGAALTHCAGA